MKIKTSITLSAVAARTLDRLAGKNGNRSAVAELAILEYAKLRARRQREARDRELFDRHGDALNEETCAVLAFQAEP